MPPLPENCIPPESQQRLDEYRDSAQNERLDATVVEPLRTKSVRQLINECPELRRPLIHGLLREGETMNVIASPKVGKSWLVVAVWVAILASGIHTTVAGTLLALLVPVRARIEPQEFLCRLRDSLRHLEQGGLTRESMIPHHGQLEALGTIHVAAEDMAPPGIHLTHYHHPVTTYLILPLFALFNAGVVINLETLQAGPLAVATGIVLGLVVGKQLGIMGLSYLIVRRGPEPPGGQGNCLTRRLRK